MTLATHIEPMTGDNATPHVRFERITIMPDLRTCCLGAACVYPDQHNKQRGHNYAKNLGRPTTLLCARALDFGMREVQCSLSVHDSDLWCVERQRKS